MTKVLFVCHGNICRSPMAEFVMKELVRQKGLSDFFVIASAATSTEELGNPIYPPARRELLRHGIDPSGKTARQLQRRDYAQYDWLIGMDQANIRNIHRICGGDPDNKIRMLLSHDVADPWYTGDFARTWEDVSTGCRALLQQLTENNNDR